MLASFRFTRTTQRRKHKHKRKEIKLKNSDKLSAYILVTHALPFAKWRQQIFMLLRLRMSHYAYAYAYHMCKHPCTYACAYAYTCVVQKLLFSKDFAMAEKKNPLTSWMQISFNRTLLRMCPS